MPTLDGRLLRGERARSQVVNALLELIQEGDIQPTVPRVAERAGVSIRLVYHHFQDQDALFHEACRQQTERFAPLVYPIAQDLPFEERLAEFVKQRTVLLEALAPTRRAALLMEPFSRAIAEGLGTFRAVKRAQVVHLFGSEIQLLPKDERADAEAQLCVAASFSTWEELRVHQGLAVPRARKVVQRMIVSALLPRRSR